MPASSQKPSTKGRCAGQNSLKSSLPHFALFESLAPERGYGSRFFSRCLEVVEAPSADEVFPALRRIEGQVAKGPHAAGFMAYEAAAAFDRASPMGAGAPDVPFVNARAELTEGTFNNIALHFGDRVLWVPNFSQA